MAQERLQQLRWMLANESRVDMAAGDIQDSEQDPEKDEHSDSEKDKHSDSDEEHDAPVDAFRQAVQSERQVALLVDGDTEHVPFLIGDVCPGQGPGLAPLRIAGFQEMSHRPRQMDARLPSLQREEAGALHRGERS
jgi:hypothetical protein